MNTGRRFCSQAVLYPSNASLLRCLNGLRGASTCSAFLFQPHLKSYSPCDGFPVVPAWREQACEVFALAILQLNDKILTTASL